MKKNILAAILTISTTTFLSAQVTLTYATHGINVGDVSTTFQLSSFTGINPGPSGLGQTWNFNYLVFDTTNSLNSVFVDPATTSFASLFPTSNLANGGSYYYSTPDSLTYLGSANSFDTTLFSDPKLLATFPFAYSNNFSDQWFSTNTYFSEFGSDQFTADGTGTLILSSGSYSVIRVAGGSSYIDSATVPFLSTSISITRWYSATTKFCLLEIDNSSQVDLLNNGVGSTTTVYINALVAGVTENKLSPIQLSLFPNPSSGNTILNFTLSENQKIDILISDITGKTILEINRGILVPGLHEEKIDLTTLSQGIYFIKVQGEKSSGIQKLIVQ